MKSMLGAVSTTPSWTAGISHAFSTTVKWGKHCVELVKANPYYQSISAYARGICSQIYAVGSKGAYRFAALPFGAKVAIGAGLFVASLFVLNKILGKTGLRSDSSSDPIPPKLR